VGKRGSVNLAAGNRLRWTAVTSEPEHPADPSDNAAPSNPAPQPPELPARLLEQWPVIAAGAAAWLVATVLAFTVPALEGWRPVSIAGLAVGVLGTSIFLWQRSAAQRGARGAQTGLTIRNNRSEM
jgi:hypothetical protein